MAVYLLLALTPVLLGVFFGDIKHNKKRRIKYFILCGVIMLFFMGLRHYSLGSTDTLHYYNRMKYAISCNTWESFYEPDLYETGFQVFMFIVARVFHHPQWILVISSLFYIISIFYFIDHNSEDISLSITLYISLGLMTFHLQGMRQAMAMCICLFAYEQAKKKKFFRFLLLVLLATTFHQTAIVFIVVYWIVRLKLNRRNVFLVSLISLVAIACSAPLVNVANTIFNEDYSGTVDSGGFVAVAIYIITLVVCYLYYSSYEQDCGSPLVLVAIIGTATYLMRYTGVMIAERISFYFVFSQIALLPLVAKLIKPRERIIVNAFIVLLAVGLFAYRLGDSGFLPYSFHWS